MLLTLDRIGENTFRNRYNQRNVNNALYGGQVLAQALVAANTTAEGRAVSSLHCYFLRAGIEELPIDFEVERTRDGKSFSTRRVLAVQRGSVLFQMECSFRTDGSGFEHQAEPLQVTPPEELEGFWDIVRRGGPEIPPQTLHHLERGNPIEARPVDGYGVFLTKPVAKRQIWIRVPSAAATDDLNCHSHILAYMSDQWVGSTSLLPHTRPVPMAAENLFCASIDHSVWFHRQARVDDWLLCEFDSPSASGGTGFSRGQIFDRKGRLIASTAQEAVQRRRA